MIQNSEIQKSNDGKSKVHRRQGSIIKMIERFFALKSLYPEKWLKLLLRIVEEA